MKYLRPVSISELMEMRKKKPKKIKDKSKNKNKKTVKARLTYFTKSCPFFPFSSVKITFSVIHR